MKTFFLTFLFVVPATFAGSPAPASEHHAPKQATHAEPAPAAKEKAPTHWSYAGKDGPPNWAKLDPAYLACAEGKEQSPVDLKWSKQKGKRKLSFHYAEGPLHLVDNGHTIQVNVPVGSYLLIDGERYSLLQFHFHAHSEHTFSGRHFPLEAHFVHKNSEGKLAVVGVMFEVGAKNLGLETVFLNMPGKANEERRVATRFNPATLLPSIHTHYQYQGSLTTPPCSEGVNWTVLNTPMPISPEQLAQFQRAYVHNSRPIQELYERRPASF